MSKYSQLQMISMLPSMQCDDGLKRGQSPSSPKGLTWHAAQYMNYGSGWHVGSPQVPFLMCTLEIPQKLQYKFFALNFGYFYF